MNKPFFSIIIPVYNRAYCINDTIKSCLEQSFDDFEIILADDGSTDNLEEAISEIVKQNPDKVKLCKLKKNMGVSAARNFGVEQASGSYIAYLDSDDRFHPNKLESYYNKIKEYNFPKDTVFYTIYELSREGRPPIIKNSRAKKDNESVMEYHFGNFEGAINTCTCLAKELALTHKFQVGLSVCEDIKVALDIEKSGGKFVWLGEEEAKTIVSDERRTDRLSQGNNYKKLKYWYELVKDDMTPRIQGRLKAKRLAPMLVYSNLPKAILMVLSATFRGHLRPMEIPRVFYRLARSFIARLRS